MVLPFYYWDANHLRFRRHTEALLVLLFFLPVDESNCLSKHLQVVILAVTAHHTRVIYGILSLDEAEAHEASIGIVAWTIQHRVGVRRPPKQAKLQRVGIELD